MSPADIPLGSAWWRLLWARDRDATALLGAIARAHEAQWTEDDEAVYATRQEEEEGLHRLVERWAREELVRWHTRLARRGFPRMDPHDARNWFPVELVDR